MINTEVKFLARPTAKHSKLTTYRYKVVTITNKSLGNIKWSYEYAGYIFIPNSVNTIITDKMFTEINYFLDNFTKKHYETTVRKNGPCVTVFKSTGDDNVDLRPINNTVSDVTVTTDNKSLQIFKRDRSAFVKTDTYSVNLNGNQIGKITWNYSKKSYCFMITGFDKVTSDHMNQINSHCKTITEDHLNSIPVKTS